VVIAMLFHAWDDTLVNFSKALFAGPDVTQLAWLHAGIYALAAIAITVAAIREVVEAARTGQLLSR
jgi:hypothetical protein